MLARGGGRARRADLAGLAAAVEAQNDITLAELQASVPAADGGTLSRASISHWLIHLGLGRKKTFRALEADEEERQGFRDLVGADAPRPVPLRGRNGHAHEHGPALRPLPLRGQRVHGVVPRNTPPNLSMVGAMNTEGILCAMEWEGAIDGDAFLVFIAEVLGPHLRRGDFVVMDNLNTHCSPEGGNSHLRARRFPLVPTPLPPRHEPHPRRRGPT